MDGPALEKWAIEVLGKPGWRKKLAGHLGIDPVTVWRITRPGATVPGPVAAAVKCWQDRGMPTGSGGTHDTHPGENS